MAKLAKSNSNVEPSSSAPVGQTRTSQSVSDGPNKRQQTLTLSRRAGGLCYPPRNEAKQAGRDANWISWPGNSVAHLLPSHCCAPECTHTRWPTFCSRRRLLWPRTGPLADADAPLPACLCLFYNVVVEGGTEPSGRSVNPHPGSRVGGTSAQDNAGR